MEQYYITKSELAQRILPNIAVASAVNRMMTWVKRNPTLTEKLEQMGYRKTQKYLSPKMVAAIEEYLVI